MFTTMITAMTLMMTQPVPADYQSYSRCETADSQWGYDESCDSGCDCGCEEAAPAAVGTTPVVRPMSQPSVPKDLATPENHFEQSLDTSLLTLDTAKALPRDVMVFGTNFYIVPSLRAGLGYGLEAGVTMFGVYPMFTLKKEIISTDSLVVSGSGAALIADDGEGLMFAGLKSQLSAGPLNLYGDIYFGVPLKETDSSSSTIKLARLGAKARLTPTLSLLGEVWSASGNLAMEDGVIALMGMRFTWYVASKPRYVDVFMVSHIDEYGSTDYLPMLMMNYGLTF